MATASAFTSAYFEKVYRNYARQNPKNKLAFYADLVERHVPPAASPVILDLGCAFGRFLGHLDDRWQKFGIDVSAHAITQAGKAVPAGKFAVGSCASVPFRKNCDAVVAFDVLEHVPDLGSVAADVCSVLRAEGIFVFVVPVYDGPLGPVVELLDRDPTHIHKKSRQFWLSWASEWFEVQEWYGLFRYLLPAGPYLHFATERFRSVAPAIAIAARSKPRRK